MRRNPLFHGITRENEEKLLAALAGSVRTFSAGETVYAFGGEKQGVCVVLSGVLRLMMLEPDGRYGFLERLGPGMPFGNLFCEPAGDAVLVAEAEGDVQVLCLDAGRLLAPRTAAQPQYAQFMTTLFSCSAALSRALTRRISVLTAGNMERRLLLYFRFLAADAHGTEFDLPLSFVDLAAYLAADRSAMMRQLRCMEREGIVCREGRRIRLLNFTGTIQNKGE